MAYPDYEPIDPREAFEVTPYVDSEGTQSAAASQAALLLTARAGVLGVTDEDEYEREEASKTGFELPDVRPLRRSRRMRVEEATRQLGMSARELKQEVQPDLQSEMARTARELYTAPTTETAAALFEAALHSTHPLVQVAAAAGARETTRLRRPIREILEREAQSDEALVARLAEAAMGTIDRSDPMLQERVIDRPQWKSTGRRSNTAVVTHGTWAPNQPWYQPGGDFYDQLNQNRPDLDVHDPSFTWTGGYSHDARRLGAIDLAAYLAAEGIGNLDLFAHSHGGTVAHLATKRGVAIERLVLMGWPVHERWFPDFGNVGRIIDVRVRLDLVIMLDRGGQRFRTNQFNIEEHRNGWFDHSSTHEPAYWDQHGLWGVV